MKSITKLELLESFFNIALCNGAEPDLYSGEVIVHFDDDTKVVTITLIMPENKQYTACFGEEVLNKINEKDLMNEIVIPQIKMLKRAVMKGDK